MDELPIKIRVKDSADCVVHEPVAHAGFVDIARLRVIDLERVVRSVTICSFIKFPMQVKNIIHKAQRELGHVLALFLFAQELFPR